MLSFKQTLLNTYYFLLHINFLYEKGVFVYQPYLNNIKNNYSNILVIIFNALVWFYHVNKWFLLAKENI